MSAWSKILPLSALILITCGTAPSLALAKPAGFCLECHSSRYLQSLKDSSPVWDRSIYQARVELCPGIRSLSEENSFTESRIVRINAILKRLEQDGWAMNSSRKKVFQIAESFSRLKNDEIAAASQFARESSGLRIALQKVYEEAIRYRTETSQRRLIGVGILAFIAVMVLLGIGLDKLDRMGKTILLFLLIGGSLPFNACSLGPTEPTKKSPAQEQLEQLLSVATQVSSGVEEGFYRSILLAQVAREWAPIDPEGSDRAFQLAWKMAWNNLEEAGKLRPIQENLSRWSDRTEAKKKEINYDTLLDLRDELRNSVGRAWALRAIAEEWVQASEKKGRSALEVASQIAGQIRDPEIRDRDLKSIAEAWGRIDEKRAGEISRSIADPLLRSLTLMNLAQASRNQDSARNLISEAWKTAQSIPSFQLQSRSLARISAAGGKMLPREKEFWADQMTVQIKKLKDWRLRSSVLQDVISEWAPVHREQAERWTASIPAEFSEGRAYSFILLSQRPGVPRAQAIILLKKALAETKGITDSFESERIKSLAGKGLAKIEPQSTLRLLSQIEDPFYRSEMLGEMAGQLSRQEPKGALELAEEIPLEAFRLQMTVKIIGPRMGPDRERVYQIYREALRAAQSISDPYARSLSLIELGKNWGHIEKGREDFPFEAALKSVGQISSASNQAEILEAPAASWKNFDPARGQAVLERIDPSVGRARRSAAEVRLWSKTDPIGAEQWADGIPSSFAYDKSMALKEVAVNLKKGKPQAALGVLEKALQQALALPEGPRRSKLLSELAAELAFLDREWTLRIIPQLSDRQVRDHLLTEIGTLWAREDPLQALKAAREIPEGSLRVPIYQKAADGAVQKFSRTKTDEEKPALISALVALGLGREKAKKEALQAVPFFAQALEEIEKVTDPLTKSHLWGVLAAEWAPIDEQKALKVAEKISSQAFSEPFSYALLQVGDHYKKWNRKEAQNIFQKALWATDNLGDASLRAQRLLQLARQWRGIDQEKGKEVPNRAEREARSINISAEGIPILAQILQTQVTWEPENSLSISRNAGSFTLQTSTLLEGAKVLQEKSIQEGVKALEKALQSAQKEKNYRLMGEVAAAWYSLSPQKGLEILQQIEARDVRIETLRQMAMPKGYNPREEARELLDRATNEALAVDGLTHKVQSLKEIGDVWSGIDKERAKATYLKIYQIISQEDQVSRHSQRANTR